MITFVSALFHFLTASLVTEEDPYLKFIGSPKAMSYSPQLGMFPCQALDLRFIHGIALAAEIYKSVPSRITNRDLFSDLKISHTVYI